MLVNFWVASVFLSTTMHFDSGSSGAGYQPTLQMVTEIAGVSTRTSTDVILAKLGLESLQHVWLLGAAEFWNSLAGKPVGTMYKL